MKRSAVEGNINGFAITENPEWIFRVDVDMVGVIRFVGWCVSRVTNCTKLKKFVYVIGVFWV